jgi:MoxR-like ATPase
MTAKATNAGVVDFGLGIARSSNAILPTENRTDTWLTRQYKDSAPLNDSTETSSLASSSDLLAPDTVRQSGESIGRLLDGLRSVILGQEELVQLVVTCLLARGHMLLEGLPGLGKTELVKALASLLDLEFRRAQFTPDLLPSDILGSPVLQDVAGGRQFIFHKGPIFTNLLLADEINRATPKTQAALLEAMQEHRVTVLGETHVLPQPFLVLATQNPIELEGTYPLPEAQLDRFTFKINVTGVSADTLQEIITTRRHGEPPALTVVMSPAELAQLIDNVDRVHLPEGVANWISRLVAATTPDTESERAPAHTPETVTRFVRYGASPRAAIALADTSRAAALLAGKPNVGFDEVRRVAHSVLSHRLILDYSARMEGCTTKTVVDDLLKSVPEIVNR